MTDSRAALFGYRLRFAPEAQSIRQSVADHIILRNLRASEHPEGESVGRLNVLHADGKDLVVLSLAETRTALSRLRQQDLARDHTWKNKQRWKLTPKGEQQLNEQEATTTSIVSRCSRTLFGDHEELEKLRDALVGGLALLFDDLARSYLSLIIEGTASTGLRVAPEKVAQVVESLQPRVSTADRETLEFGLRRIFEESTPEFDWLKWTFCKNYYLARAMGVGADADVLSVSLFSESTFYLDSNLLIVALDPTSLHYAAIHQIISGLRRIGAELQVLRVTIDEIRDVAQSQSKNLDNVLRQIPDRLLPKVSGIVARAEAKHRADPSAPSPQDVLQRLEDAERLLSVELGLEVVDDPWFEEASNSEEIRKYAEHLRVHYDAFVRSGRRKSHSAALHDALALRWASERTKGDSYFLTLDSSLPTSGKYRDATAADRRSAAFLAYGLLPWLGVTGEEDDAVSESYSALLAAQLLSAQGRFRLQEFRILAELEMECSSLPAEDVEQCLLYLRREARHVDLAKAEDREKVNGLIKGFFASPDRKYLAEVSALREELEAARDNLNELEKQRTREVEGKQKKVEELESRNRRERAKGRLLISAALYALMLVTCIVIASQFGDGENIFQQIGDLWWLFGVVTFFGLSLARWLCRGDLWEEAKEMLHIVGQN